jgi:hypothetical protein
MSDAGLLGGSVFIGLITVVLAHNEKEPKSKEITWIVGGIVWFIFFCAGSR